MPTIISRKRIAKGSIFKLGPQDDENDPQSNFTTVTYGRVETVTLPIQQREYTTVPAFEAGDDQPQETLILGDELLVEPFEFTMYYDAVAVEALRLDGFFDTRTRLKFELISPHSFDKSKTTWFGYITALTPEVLVKNNFMKRTLGCIRDSSVQIDPV